MSSCRLVKLIPDHASLEEYRRKIDALAEDQQQLADVERDSDDAYWADVECDQVVQLENYREKFPNGAHITKAEQCIQEIKEIEIVTTYVNWVQSAIDAGDLDEAESNFKELKERSPDHASLTEFETKIETLSIEVERQRQQEIADELQRQKDFANEPDHEEYERELDNDDWSYVDCEDVEQLIDYKYVYPDGLHVEEANDCLLKIQFSYDSLSLMGEWIGKGKEMFVLRSSVTFDISDDVITFKAVYKNGGICERKLIPEFDLAEIKLGHVISLSSEFVAGKCFEAADFELELVGENVFNFEWFKSDLRAGYGQVTRNE